jgi:hypothetical protein
MEKVESKETKIRGAPKDEVPRSPLLRKLNSKATGLKPADPNAPHNPIEEAIQHGKEEAKRDGLLHHETHAHKVAIITGASSGIGKAVALHLASNNYNLVLVARKKEGLHEVEQELAKYSIKALVRECDVTKPVQVHESVQHAIKEFGRIDVLVNCAGVGIYGDLEEMRLEDINSQMLTNYFGTVLFIKEALPKLKASNGVIVNIASIAGLVGMPMMAAYSASKHAVVGLSESLRFELHGTGVSVSCICPGKVKTALFKHESFKDVAWAHDESYGIEPSAVARAVHKAINERKFLYVTPPYHRWQVLIGRLLPHSTAMKMVKRNIDK